MVVSDFLCYAIVKLKRIEKQPLKNAMLDFYTPQCILAAKELLLNEADVVMPEKWVKPAKHRLASVGQHNLAKEIDDIFSVIQLIDEAQVTDKLPLFVSDNPDNMPLVRLTDGDLVAVLQKLARLENTVMNVSKSVELLNQTVMDTSRQNSAQFPIFQHSTRGQSSRGGRGGGRGQPGVSPFRGARERPAVESTDDESGARGDRQDGAGGAQQSTRGRSVRGGRGGLYLYNQQDFSPLPGHREASSTFETRGLDPGVRGEGHDGGVRLSQGEGFNQEGACGGAYENQHRGNWADEVEGDDPFTLVERSRKRHHPSVSPQTDQQTSYAGMTERGGNTAARRGAGTPRRDVTAQRRDASNTTINRPPMNRQQASTTVIGQGSSVGLKAAEKRVNEHKKAVFCVSNVDSCYGCDDIVQYCANVGVVVSGCFDVTPVNKNRYSKCFRVTGLESDRDKILDANFWPNQVNIRPWVHRAGGGPTEGQYRPRSENMGHHDGQPLSSEQQPIDMDIGTQAQFDTTAVALQESAGLPSMSLQADSGSIVVAPAQNQLHVEQPELGTAPTVNSVELSDILQEANNVLHGQC